MSYNGSGTFQINTSGQPVVTGTSISSTVFNALTADLATGLSTAITKDGQTTTTARIPFALGINSTLVTDATNTTSGSIITAGGVGIAKAVFIGTTLNVAGASTMTGSIAVDSVTDSSSTTTGSIQTDGGVGIAKALYVGTTANVAGVATLTSNPVLSAGTANGVAYLNGSKVLTTGSALVFDGTNLGVGVTPSAWRNLFNVLQSGASSSFVGQTNSNTTYVASNWYTTSGGTDTRIAAGYASQYYQDSGQHVWRTAATSTAGSAISFTQAMTLDASNGLYLGTSTTGLFSVSNYSASTQTTNLSKNPSDQGFNIGTRNGVAGSSSGTEIARLCWGYGGTDSAYISAERNGGTGANRINVVCNMSAGVYLGAGLTSWGSLSDERQKTNLQPITDASNKLNTLRTVTGRYITDEETVSRAFLIAQDVQKVLPEAVDAQEDEEGTLGLRYTDVIPLLVAAIKEQSALITTLTDRITALEARNG